MMFDLKGVVLFIMIFLWPAFLPAFESRVDEAHPFGVIFDDTGITIKEGVGTVEFRFLIPSRSYLYRDAFSVLPDDAGVKAQLDLPASTRKYDSFQEEEVDIYLKEVSVGVRFVLPKDYDITKPISGKISYQGCSDKLCYRLMQQSFSLMIFNDKVVNRTDEHGASTQFKGSSGWFALFGEHDFSRILKEGLFITLIVCFVAGFLTGFTPCVLPVIPLTLAFMGVARSRSFFERLRRLLPAVITESPYSLPA